MTRINGSVLPKELSNKHLLAEHREIKRVCFRLKQRLQKDHFSDISQIPIMENKGGRIILKELFWLDKGLFTLKRYVNIYLECKHRGFNVQNYSKNWLVYKQKPEYFNDFEVPADYNNVILERLNKHE